VRSRSIVMAIDLLRKADGKRHEDMEQFRSPTRSPSHDWLPGAKGATVATGGTPYPGNRTTIACAGGETGECLGGSPGCAVNTTCP
jgi:hypothetical protein